MIVFKSRSKSVEILFRSHGVWDRVRLNSSFTNQSTDFVIYSYMQIIDADDGC